MTQPNDDEDGPVSLPAFETSVEDAQDATTTWLDEHRDQVLLSLIGAVVLLAVATLANRAGVTT